MVLSTQPASFPALAYTGHTAESIRKIADLGYDGVELAVRDPTLLDRGALSLILDERGLTVPAIGTGQAFGEEGLSFTDPHPDVRRRAVERVKAHMRLADGLHALVIIGLVRGRRAAGVDGLDAGEWLIEALRECASEVPGVRLAVEPINRYETDLINTVAAGLELVKAVRMKNVGLLLDTFHMNIEESDITESVVLAGDRLFHVHIADSNRWYPGAGHTDFRPIIGALHRIGYGGFLSAEILPLPDPDTAAARTIEHMRAMTA